MLTSLCEVFKCPWLWVLLSPALIMLCLSVAGAALQEAEERRVDRMRRAEYPSAPWGAR